MDVPSEPPWCAFASTSRSSAFIAANITADAGESGASRGLPSAILEGRAVSRRKSGRCRLGELLSDDIERSGGVGAVLSGCAGDSNRNLTLPTSWPSFVARTSISSSNLIVFHRRGWSMDPLSHVPCCDSSRIRTPCVPRSMTKCRFDTHVADCESRMLLARILPQTTWSAVRA